MSDDPNRQPPGGRQLEFNRSSFAASERQLEPLSNDDYENFDEIEEYPAYSDEVADYQPAPEDLFDEPADTDPQPRWHESNVESAMRWHGPDKDDTSAPTTAPATAVADRMEQPDYDTEPDYDQAGEDEPAYDTEQAYDTEPAYDPAPATAASTTVAASLGQLSQPGGDFDRFSEEQPGGERKPPSIPLGLVATAIVALLLLAAGGYGVMQQRAAMQEEIRVLQSRLATASTDVGAGASEPGTDARLEQLEQALLGLEQENRMLQMDNAALEEKLAALQAVRRLSAAEEENTAARNGAFGATPGTEVTPSAPAAPAAATPAAAQPSEPSTATTEQPAPSKAAVPAAAPDPAPPAAAPTGPWFVNFAAYSREGDARERAASLKVSAGTVRVLSVNVDGRTLYRVRVTGLADRQRADALARELEKNYGVGRLWVGKN